MTDVEGTVVDTDVFSLLFVSSSSADSRAVAWRDVLGNRRVLISFQTRAELLAGALSRNWSAQRTARLTELLNRTPTIHSDVEVVGAYATLTAECRASGHGLHDKPHTGDRWIAACAIAKRFDLLTGDAIFDGAPNLTVRN
jgi:predicted nucleic acid-binding protein